MDLRLIISFLVFLSCSSIYADDLSSIYPSEYKKDCAFPFTYNGRPYTDCTTDGDNGDIPWCSLTTEYKGLITYCYDFRNTTIQCQANFTMPGGKNYTSCDYLSSAAVYKQCKTTHPTIKYRYCTPALNSSAPKQSLRRSNCASAYQTLSKDHTMCFGPSPYANQVAITADEKQALLDMHNSYRSAVPSKYMFKLYWDDELAKLAQAHSDMCAFEHDLAENRLSPKFNWKNGQNIVMSSEIRSPLDSLIDMMLGSEKENFRYGQTCSPVDNTCLHYTQAMISNLTRVGCGQTHCVYPDRIERYLTCNYIQSQYQDNYQTPYVPSDTAASSCPAKASDGLCDCGNQICAYDKGEYLDPNTCNCKTQTGKRSIEDDLNEKELNANVEKFIGSAAGKGNLIKHQKRHFRTMAPKHLSKRSVEDDVNQKELDANVEKFIASAAGKKNVVQHQKRGFKKLTVAPPRD